MAEGDDIHGQPGQGCAARFTRRRLETALLFFYFYFYCFEGNSKVKAKGRTEFLPIAGVRAQAMIDVDCGEFVADLRRQSMQDMQQDD
jgi:hypothetical protein